MVVSVASLIFLHGCNLIMEKRGIHNVISGSRTSIPRSDSSESDIPGPPSTIRVANTPGPTSTIRVADTPGPTSSINPDATSPSGK